jgi:hypothetical protein
MLLAHALKIRPNSGSEVPYLLRVARFKLFPETGVLECRAVEGDENWRTTQPIRAPEGSSRSAPRPREMGWIARRCHPNVRQRKQEECSGSDGADSGRTHKTRRQGRSGRDGVGHEGCDDSNYGRYQVDRAIEGQPDEEGVVIRIHVPALVTCLSTGPGSPDTMLDSRPDNLHRE